MPIKNDATSKAFEKIKTEYQPTTKFKNNVTNVPIRKINLELNAFKNFAQKKDMFKRDDLFLSINLIIGIIIILVIIWMTISFCIRSYRRKSYDQIELLNFNSYND